MGTGHRPAYRAREEACQALETARSSASRVEAVVSQWSLPGNALSRGAFGSAPGRNRTSARGLERGIVGPVDPRRKSHQGTVRAA